MIDIYDRLDSFVLVRLTTCVRGPIKTLLSNYSIRNFCVHVDGDVSSQRKDLKVGERRRARNCLRDGVRGQRPHAGARHAGVQPRVQRYRGRVPWHGVRPPGSALCRYLLLGRVGICATDTPSLYH